MLTILAELEGTSPYRLRTAGSVGSYRFFGCSFLAFAPGLSSPFGSRQVRSFGDNLSVGPKRLFGDRECLNTQVSGTIHPHPNVAGGTIIAWDPFYGIPANQSCQPVSMTSGYSYEQLVDRIGSATSPSREIYWRTGESGIAAKTQPELPLVLGNSATAKSFSAEPASTVGRYAVTESCMSAKTYPVGNGGIAIFCVFATWLRYIAKDGKVLRSVGSVQYRFDYEGPSATGQKDLVMWYSTSDGMWTRTPGYPGVPSFLNALTRSQFLAYMAKPSDLTAWSPPGLAAIVTLPVLVPSDFPPTKWNGNISLASRDRREFVDVVRSSVRDYFAGISPVTEADSGLDDWQELGDTAVDNTLQTTVNHYENASQLRTTLGSLRATLALWHDIGDPKAWAKWWLSMRFGDRLLFNDLCSVGRSVSNEVRHRTTVWKRDFFVARSQSHTTIASTQARIPSADVDHYLKLYYRYQDFGWFGRAYAFGRRWALWPTASAGWDLIPYSFVVDWLVDVQSLCEEFDRDTYLQYLEVCSVIKTEKKTYDFGDIAFDNFVLSGAKLTYYHRTLSGFLPTGPFRIDRGHSSAINIVDGISLIVQTNK